MTHITLLHSLRLCVIWMVAVSAIQPTLVAARNPSVSALAYTAVPTPLRPQHLTVDHHAGSVWRAAPLAPQSSALPISETFRYSTTTWLLSGNPITPLLTVNATTISDTLGNGWLRLTNNITYQSGAAIYDQSFDPAQGIRVDFDYAGWGGTGADGITFYLYDGATTASQFHVGANGGSLGYAQKSGIAGLTNGYVGIGIDEFGNYSNPNEGRVGGPGYTPNSVAIRGPASTNYAYLTGTKQLTQSLATNYVVTRPLQTGPLYRHVAMVLQPVTTTYKIMVFMQFGAASPMQLLLGPYIMPVNPPRSLKMGFAGSTGGQVNYHEIRNLTVNVPTDIAVTKSAVVTEVLPGQNLTYTVVISNNGPNATSSLYISDVVSSNLIGVTWTCRGSSGATCPNASGTGNISETLATVFNLGNVLTYLITGTVAPTASYMITNTVTVAPSADIGDADPTNNSATVYTIVKNADLRALKSVNAPSIGEGNLVTYTIWVTNSGPSTAPNVVLTDSLPNGVSYASSSATSGSYSATTHLWSAGTLAVGAGTKLTLVGLIGLGKAGNIYNFVTGASSDVPDLNTLYNNNTPNIGFTALPTVLSGTVTDAGTSVPLVGATVVMTDSQGRTYTTTTGTGGMYTFTSSAAAIINPGTLTVSAVITNYLKLISTTTAISGAVNALGMPLLTSNLLVLIDDGRATANPGDILTYTVTVSNVNLLTATGVIISSALGAYLSYITDTTGLAPLNQTSLTRSWTWPTVIAPGSAVTFLIVARVAISMPDGTSILNATASASTTAIEADKTQNVRTDQDTVVAHPDLQLTKTGMAAHTPVQINDAITYRYSGSNLEHTIATGVYITDVLDANTNAPALTGFSVNGTDALGQVTMSTAFPTITFKLPNIAPQSSFILTYTVLAASSFPTNVVSIINSAAITLSQLDVNLANNTSQFGLSIYSGVDLYVNAAQSPDYWPELVNGSVLYTLNYGNKGGSTGASVVVTDVLPAIASYVAGTLYLNGVKQSDTLYSNLSHGFAITIGTLNTNISGVISFTAQIASVLPAGVSQMSNLAGISGADPDLLPADNYASTTTSVTGNPDLVISYGDLETSVTAGQTLTYTVNYSNTGTRGSSGAWITVTILNNLTNIVPSAGGVYADGIITWHIGTLNVDGAHAVSYTGRVPASASPAQVVAARAQIADDGLNGSDLALANNMTTDSDVIVRPYLVIQTASSGVPAFNQPLVYTITYENNGEITATNTVITAAVPANTVFISASNGVTQNQGIVTWNVGNVGPDAQGTLYFTVTVLPTAGVTTPPVATLIDQPGSGSIVMTSSVAPPAAPLCEFAGCTSILGYYAGVTYTEQTGWSDNPRLSTTSFDTTSWVTPTVPFTHEVYWVNESNLGAQFITMYTLTEESRNYSFFRQFTCLPLNATDLHASIEIASDDFGDMYLNGVYLGQKVGSGAAATYDATPGIQSGVNLLAVRLTNLTHPIHGDPYYGDHDSLLYNLNASYDDLKPFTAAPNVIKAGQSATFTVDDQALGGRRPYSYTYSYSDGLYTQDYTTSTTITRAFNTPGVYTVTVKARAALGCTGTDAHLITVLPSGSVWLDMPAGAAYQDFLGIAYAGQSGNGTELPSKTDLDISAGTVIDPAIAGAGISYTLVLTNGGPASLTGLTLTSELRNAFMAPQNAIYEPSIGAFDSTTGAWGGFTLAPGDHMTMTITGLVDPARLTALTATFSIAPLNSTDITPLDDTAAVTTGIHATADLVMIKSSTWITGSNIVTFTLSYNNAGPSAAHDVTLTDTLPVSLTYQGMASTGAVLFGPTQTNRLVTWFTPTLAVNAFDAIVITTTINPGSNGWISNTAVITSIATVDDPDQTNNAGTAFVYSQAGQPTAVAVLYFDVVKVQGRDVTLAWATGFGTTCAEYGLYRSGYSGNISFEQAHLVTVIRATLPGLPWGEYSYVDHTPSAGTWWYWLACADQGLAQADAVQVAVPALSRDYQHFVPIVILK